MKKITLLYSSLFFLICAAVTAQSCLPEGITFSTQAEIDNFSSNYPACTAIEGNLTITGANITDLNGLNVLTAVWGNLTIENTNTLTTLSGLENLNTTGGSIYIANNAALTSLSGLENLNTASGCLYITYNDALLSLSGLEDLSAVGLRLLIMYNASLTSISGLENLSSIGGFFSINNNDALADLNGPEKLSSVGGIVEIYDNDNLISLTGFENLTSVGGIEIEKNAALTSLNGLDNINYSSIIGLTIIENINLSVCEVKSICDYIENGGIADIHDNAPGCNSVTEIEEACEAITAVNNLLMNDKEEIQVFPNPTNGTFRILGINTERWMLNIKTSIGSQVRIQMLNQDEQVNISNLPSGIYFLEFKNENQSIVKQVVKE